MAKKAAEKITEVAVVKNLTEVTKTVKKPAKRKVKEGPDPDDIIVGQNLKMYRTRVGLSQNEVGEKLGITFQQIQKYEKGTNRISASKMVRLVMLLGVTYDDMFAGVTGGTDAPLNNQLPVGPVFSQAAAKAAIAFDAIPSPVLKTKVLSLMRTMASEEYEDDSVVESEAA